MENSLLFHTEKNIFFPSCPRKANSPHYFLFIPAIKKKKNCKEYIRKKFEEYIYLCFHSIPVSISIFIKFFFFSFEKG